VRDVDGKLGSGKSTRRSRRMPGLLALTAGYGHDRTPVVRFPDGWSISADDAGSAPRFDEDEWIGRTLAIGADIVVRVRKPMIRCIMVDLSRAGLAADGHVLDTLGRVNDTKLGLVVDVVSPGALRLGDPVRVASRT